MRLSGLSLAAVLIFSSIVFAQHSGTSSTPSAPAASPAPAAAPSPSHSSSPSSTPSSSSSSSSSSSHSSMSSAPASVHENHSAPSSGATFSHTPNSAASETHSAPSASRVRQPDTERVTPDQRVSGESRIVGAPRIGEHPVEKPEEPKPAEPDLRHRVCEGAECKEPAKVEPPQPDLRHRVCVTGNCGCPPGQTAGKGGCVTPPPPTPPAGVNDTRATGCETGTVWNGTACASAPGNCPVGLVWNGVSCAPYRQCRAGETWDGTRCVSTPAECAGYEGRAAPLVMELRNLRAEVQQACGANPSGQACIDLRQDQQNAHARYLGLWSEAPSACRTTLPDPGSLL